jgi:hypothetical protein
MKLHLHFIPGEWFKLRKDYASFEVCCTSWSFRLKLCCANLDVASHQRYQRSWGLRRTQSAVNLLDPLDLLNINSIQAHRDSVKETQTNSCCNGFHHTTRYGYGRCLDNGPCKSAFHQSLSSSFSHYTSEISHLAYIRKTGHLLPLTYIRSE